MCDRIAINGFIDPNNALTMEHMKQLLLLALLLLKDIDQTFIIQRGVGMFHHRVDVSSEGERRKLCRTKISDVQRKRLLEFTKWRYIKS